jgi:hypothetical protein
VAGSLTISIPSLSAMHTGLGTRRAEAVEIVNAIETALAKMLAGGQTTITLFDRASGTPANIGTLTWVPLASA